MLLLLFKVGLERYCVDVSRIIEIAPFVELKAIPNPPHGLIGLFNYRGSITPVIDLSLLLAGSSSQRHLSTRIILFTFTGRKGEARTIGLLAEQATETIFCRKEDFRPSNLTDAVAPFLGDILLDERGMIQLLVMEKILTEELEKALFSND